MKERKPGFDYFFSKSINKEVAVSKKSGILYTEDGVTYSPEELKVLDCNNDTIPESVHIVKKIFGGMLIPPGAGESDGDRPE